MKNIIISLLIICCFTYIASAKDTATFSLLNCPPSAPAALSDDGWRPLSLEETAERKESFFLRCLDWTLEKSLDICYFLGSNFTYHKIDFLECQLNKLQAYRQWLKENYAFKFRADINSFAVSLNLYTKKW